MTVDILKPCFVICPIGEEASETRKRSDQVLRHIVKPAAEACGYAANRADEIDKPGLITSQVIQRVVSDPLVIADLTEMNPNVFYELAVRHAIRKPLVQIIEKNQRIPFDVAATRTIHVDHKDLDSVDSAKKEIIAQIKSLEKNPEEIETPISVSIELQNLRQSDNPEDRNFAEILAELSEMRVQLSKLTEGVGSRIDVDLMRLLKNTEQIIERDYLRSGYRAPSAERALVEISRATFFHNDPAAKASAYAALAAAARTKVPWVYEGAMEVYRQYVFSSEAKAAESEKKFRKYISDTMEAPWNRELINRDKSTMMILEVLHSITSRGVFE